jgi:hypothetical protein
VLFEADLGAKIAQLSALATKLSTIQLIMKIAKLNGCQVKTSLHTDNRDDTNDNFPLSAELLGLV